MNSDEENTVLDFESSNEEDMDLIFAENLEKLTKEEIEKRDQVKMQVADKLKKFQNKEAKRKDFRILQGVLSKSFSRREQTFTEQLTLRKAEKKDYKRRMLS